MSQVPFGPGSTFVIAMWLSPRSGMYSMAYGPNCGHAKSQNPTAAAMANTMPVIRLILHRLPERPVHHIYGTDEKYVSPGVTSLTSNDAAVGSLWRWSSNRRA